MKRHKVGLYLEVEAPGVDTLDAARRAADAIQRSSLGGKLYGSLHAGGPPDPELEIKITMADPIERAARNGWIVVTPKE